MTPMLVVRSRRVITPAGTRPAAIHIQDGKITVVSSYDDVPAGAILWDGGGLVVMPGLIDTHVHINEPGRTEWEGFWSATRAAAAGGVTTLIDMPLNSIPVTTTREALKTKIKAAEGQCWVDVGFWGGVIPGNHQDLRALHEAGVFGFKCFLVPSGIPEFGHVGEKELRIALPEIATFGSVLLVHAELPGPIDTARARAPRNNPRQYDAWLGSHPHEAEDEAIRLMVGLSREYSARVHIVHLSSACALDDLKRAKAQGVPVTIETCPHYLSLAAEEIGPGATEAKCAPPVRERESRERLWTALADGAIDMVVSDHSPCPPEMKCGSGGDFLRAWGGISSLQCALPVVWSEARRRNHTVKQLVEWMSRGPARLAGLEKRKGAIDAGYQADLVAWNPEATFRLEPSQLHHRHKLTPYAGRPWSGTVEATFLRGELIFEHGRFCDRPTGRLLSRGQLKP